LSTHKALDGVLGFLTIHAHFVVLPLLFQKHPLPVPLSAP